MLLGVLLAGDVRLLEKLRCEEELLPLGSRIRARLVLEPIASDELMACLNHQMSSAGNASLMTPELCRTLCDHADGNYRILTTMGCELLMAAAR